MTTPANAIDHLQVIPSGGALGAEITGLDLGHALQQDVVDAVYQTLLDHCVVVFRNQHISEEDQVRFTNYFGRAVEHVREQVERPIKEVFIISNIQENGQVIGALGNAEITFHSDLSYMQKPGTLSLLYAVELPTTGGDTHWCNCAAAYEALDDEFKRRLQDLRAVHRHYIEEQNPPEIVDHPVVRTHPENGRKSLYVGPHLTKYIVGGDEAQSRALLEQLFEHMLQPHFIWTHNWQVGDLVVWDNRSTMHRRDPFPADQLRLMKRTQIFNDEIPY